MLSLGSVAASENVNSDDADNNDLISLPVYSELEFDDNGNMPNDVNEVSLETNDNKTHSSDDVLKVSHNSPLGADPSSGTFDDIQKAIDTAVGGTVFLNGTNYSGNNNEITIDKDIIIDGANSQGNGVSILDAKSASRIFNSSGNYNIVLKNLIFENPILNTNGYCVYFNGGNITIQNLTIRNIKGTSTISKSNPLRSAIYLGQDSTLNVSNLTFKNNSIDYTYSYNQRDNGVLLMVGQSSNVEIRNLNICDNNITVYSNLKSLRINGAFVNIGTSSKVNMSDVNFCNNYLNVTNNTQIFGGFFYGASGNFSFSNLNFESNRVFNFTEAYSLIRVQDSNITLTNVHFYRNFFSGGMCYGTILSAMRCRALVNYCYIEDNIVYSPNHTAQAGFITIHGVGIVNQCHSLNNFVDCADGGILRFSLREDYDELSYLENSTFVNTTLEASDISLDRFGYSDHGGVLCIGGSRDVAGAVLRNCSFINNCNSLGGAIGAHGNSFIDNCTFINNTATKFFGGAINTFFGYLINDTGDPTREITIKDSYFEGNTAPLGGAIYASGDNIHIHGCNFVDNTACKGGAVFLLGNTIDLHNSTFMENVATDDIPEVVFNETYNIGVLNWNVEGGAVYIYGNSTDLYNNTFMHNEAIGNNSDGCGGAIYVYGDNATINENHFDANFANGGNGSAVFIYGLNTTVKNSEFFNHFSKNGAVYIIGNEASILNSIFKHNIASFGGAVFIDANYSLLDNNTFTDNNATVHGGAVHISGDNAAISNSTFLSNNAIPHSEGLGGAIFIKGNYIWLIKNLYDNNTARNGSAIYNRGHVHIDTDKFLKNQAFSYLLNITATPKVSNHTGSNQVLINVTFVGGDNIINAIYNDGDIKKMFFRNVTYEHSTGEKRTPENENINPVDGAEKSQDGKLLYQDSREDYQDVALLIVKEKNSNSGLLMAPSGITGDVIINGTYKTGLYGNISLLLNNLDSGNYSVYAEHPEDRLYKQIENSTTFEIIPQVDLQITKTVSNSTPKYKDEITWNITVINHGPSVAENVIVEDVLPNGLVYLYDNSAGKYDSARGKWKIGNLAQNEEVILVITTLVNVTNTTITNTAVVKSSTYDKNDTNNEDNDTITVDPFADLAIEKTVSPHYPKKGAVVTWTITVTNNGPDTAVNALVRDVLPSGLEFIGSGGNYDGKVWRIGDIANGGTAVLNITTRILVTDAVITNIANVTSDTPDYDLTNNEDDATVDIGHEADLAIVKVVSNPTPKFGEVITWTITVTNNGPDRAIDVVVHDVLPSGLVYISDDSNGYYDNVSGIWTIGILQNSASVTLHILSQVNITNATITNVAVVDSDTHDPNETNNEDNDTITVDSFADLAIEKIVSPHYPKMNDVVTWTITVTNNGPDTAVNALVRDVLPSGLEFIESSGNYTNNVWYIGDMAKGDTAVLNITTRILVTDAVITNVANVSSDTPDLDLTNNVDNATLDIGHEADLSIVKSVSNSNPKFGDIITWTITVTNNGPDRAIDVVVHDKLPNGLIYIVDDSNGKYDDVSGVWTIETLQNKESITLNILSKVNITNATIMNVALVDSDTHDLNETNNKDNDTITVNPFADLAIENTVSPHYPKKGDVVTWTITVTNNGPDTAVNAFVRDVLPSGLEFIESDGNYTNNIWYIGDMANGHIFILNIKTRILLTGAVITNVAEVASDTPDYDLTNNVDNATVDSDHEADLAIVKVVSDSTPKVGDVITWTITVTNKGPDRAVDVVVHDKLPDGLVYISDDSNGKYDDVSGVWTIGTLQNNASVTLKILSQVNIINAIITNVALVDSDTHDSNETNNRANDTIFIRPFADLSIEKTVSPHYPKKGDVVTWTITVTNNGLDTAVNAFVRDVLPSGLEFIESDGNYTNNVWYIGDIANGGTAVLNIKTRILLTDAVITNIAEVASDTPDYDLTNNVDNATVDIGHEADLAIVKVVSDSTPKSGDVVTWTITVTNKGPDRAIDVVVHDKLPNGLVYISDDSNGKYDDVSGVWTIGTLQNNTSVTLNILSLVNITNAIITNVALVDSDTHDPDETNNRANDTILIRPFADLSIEKTVSPHYPKMNDVVTWTITVTNNGPDMAVNAFVRDVLPSGLEFIESDGNYTNNVWYIGDIANGGTAILNIKTRILVTGAVITNVANVTSDTHDYDLTNNVDNATVDIGHEADLAITKVVSNSTPKLDDIVTWTITVTNNGPDRAINVVVYDVLPKGLELIESDGVFSDNMWYIGNLANGDAAVLNIKTRVLLSNAVITNVANVTSDTYDINLTNNVGNDTIVVPPQADLSIVKDVNAVKAGIYDMLVWTITLSNNGPDTAENIVVKEILPLGLKLLSAEADAGSYSDGIWRIDSLNNGDVVTLKLVTEVTILNGTITNIVNVESSTYDPNKDNNNAVAVVNIISNETESNETESNDTVIKESVSSSSPLALYPTANPFAIVILALLSIVFVHLRRIKL